MWIHVDLLLLPDVIPSWLPCVHTSVRSILVTRCVLASRLHDDDPHSYCACCRTRAELPKRTYLLIYLADLKRTECQADREFASHERQRYLSTILLYD